MYWLGLQRGAGAAPLFLHAARHHLLGAGTRFEVLLQQSTQLRAETASGLRACAARFVRDAHKFASQTNLSPPDQISGSDASRSGFAAVSQRRSTLMAFCSDGAAPPCRGSNAR